MDEEIGFETFYKNCRKVLLKITTKIWPTKGATRPTLYSGRHQFSANMKAAGLRPAELGALMGHATEITSQVHYGKRKEGRRKISMVRANDEEVKRVKVVVKKKFDHKKKIDSKPLIGSLF